MGIMSELNKTGDTRITWDSGKKVEVDNARDTFNGMKKKGYAAYSVNDDGKKKEIITEFDAEAEKIILVPPMKGG